MFPNQQDDKQFTIATHVFWSAFSAHQRGVCSEDRQYLLEYVCSKVARDWSKNKVYCDIWTNQHDKVVQTYVDAFKKFTLLWLSTPAGKEYIANIAYQA